MQTFANLSYQTKHYFACFPAMGRAFRWTRVCCIVAVRSVIRSRTSPSVGPRTSPARWWRCMDFSTDSLSLSWGQNKLLNVSPQWPRIKNGWHVGRKNVFFIKKVFVLTFHSSFFLRIRQKVIYLFLLQKIFLSCIILRWDSRWGKTSIFLFNALFCIWIIDSTIVMFC